jgi:hypothetical protein
MNTKATKAYTVKLDGKVIDVVFYTGYSSPEEVRRSLIDHDGYSPEIVVTLNRKIKL